MNPTTGNLIRIKRAVSSSSERIYLKSFHDVFPGMDNSRALDTFYALAGNKFELIIKIDGCEYDYGTQDHKYIYRNDLDSSSIVCERFDSDGNMKIVGIKNDWIDRTE